MHSINLSGEKKKNVALQVEFQIRKKRIKNGPALALLSVGLKLIC